MWCSLQPQEFACLPCYSHYRKKANRNERHSGDIRRRNIRAKFSENLSTGSKVEMESPPASLPSLTERKIHFNSSLPFTSRVSKWSLYSSFPTKTLYAHLLTRHSCYNAQPISVFLDLITRMILGVECIS